MANITRIKAGSQKKDKKSDKNAETKKAEKKQETKPVTKETKEKLSRKEKKAEKKARKAEKKANKEVGYFRGAWQELRQVRWPSRKDTWKMTLSVIVYVLIFAGIIMVLDWIFQAISKLVIGA
jgi:preprotein translocase SecE subunit